MKESTRTGLGEFVGLGFEREHEKGFKRVWKGLFRLGFERGFERGIPRLRFERGIIEVEKKKGSKRGFVKEKKEEEEEEPEERRKINFSWRLG